MRTAGLKGRQQRDGAELLIGIDDRQVELAAVGRNDVERIPHFLEHVWALDHAVITDRPRLVELADTLDRLIGEHSNLLAKIERALNPPPPKPDPAAARSRKGRSPRTTSS